MEYEDLKIIEEKAAALGALADGVWEHPETAFTEFVSAGLLADFLEKEGFAVTRGVADIPTAFSARYGSGRPVIGLLGEFDALSGLSQKAGVAQPCPLEAGGNGHGCGHNLLGVGSLAAALAVKQYLQRTGASGTVIYYGCPGEEGGSGKAFMARSGVFGELDCALSWHPAEVTNVMQSTTLANIQVLYTFEGIAAHAAGCPEKGRSALDAMELMNVGTNFLREHMIDAARIHYAIIDGGGISPNVVQPHASVLYLIRAPRTEQAQELYRRVNLIAQGMAMATSLARHMPGEIAAVVGLSGFVVPGEHPLFADERLREQRLPMFWGRDPQDPVIPPELVDATAEWALEHADVMKVHYTGVGHGVSPPELGHVGESLTQVVLRG